MLGMRFASVVVWRPHMEPAVKLWRHFFAFFYSLVWVSLNYVRLGGGVCRAVTFFTVQSLVKATIHL